MSNTEHESIHRVQMPTRMAKEVRYQIMSLSRTNMGGYTYEQIKSHYKDAKHDLSVYNTDGKLVLLGREFGDRTFFWSAEQMDARLVS